MPDGHVLNRITPEFTHESTPEGLRRAHRIAKGVWGRLKVLEGQVEFVFEESPGEPKIIESGNSIDIPPDTPHHVKTFNGCRFVVEFYTQNK